MSLIVLSKIQKLEKRVDELEQQLLIVHNILDKVMAPKPAPLPKQKPDPIK